MNVGLRQPMTVEDFLAWEEHQELRYEFDGFSPVAMTGGTYEHDAIQVNLNRALANRLAGKRCRTHGNSIKIEVMGSVRYPDAVVTCGPIERGSMVLRDPVVIFEVLSKGTARTDRMAKNREYASTASVHRYVMLEQGAIEATMFERAGEDWVGHILADGAVIRMPEIDIEIPLAELYERLDFSSSQAGEDG
ncbi:MAG: Uma2 family endonuclease [Pseudomonadota bacterium]|nr:Uma2 family endonuclease [Pseudomonadota bacterium]